MNNYKRIVISVLLLLLLVVTPAMAQAAKQSFQWIVAQRMTITRNGILVQAGGVSVTSGDVAVTAGVTAADVTASDDVGVGDDLTVVGDAIYTAPVRASLSATQTLAPITANVPISSAASAGVIITCAAGKIYYVNNVGAQSIIITDSGTMKINSTYTMGATDSITLLGVGSNCVELGRANN